MSSICRFLEKMMTISDDTLSPEVTKAAHELAMELTKIIIDPIVKWVDGKQTVETQILSTAHMTAVVTCMCILEDIFGAEVLRAYIDRHKTEVNEFANATRH